MSKEEENRVLPTIEQLQSYLDGKPVAPEHTEIISALFHNQEKIVKRKEEYEDQHLPFITNFPNQQTANIFNQLWTTYVDGLKSELWFDYLTRDLKLFTAIGGERSKLVAETTQPKIILGRPFDPNQSNTT